jgi:hypothetical protein
MGWKEREKIVLAGLSDVQRAWVMKRVNLEGDNDLAHKSREELCAMFPEKGKPAPGEPVVRKLSDRACLRTLVWQEWLKIQVGEHEPVQGNLRTFWYRVLEPFYLDKDLMESDVAIPAGIFFEACAQRKEGQDERFREALERGEYGGLREHIEREAPGLAGRLWRNAREGYLQNLVSVVFDECVRQGIFRFQGAFMFNDPREDFRIIGKKRARVVFFTEKEGLWWLCEYAAETHGITAVASKGEPGLLAMEYIYDALRRAKVGTVEIGAITDYDPWGWNIAHNFMGKMGLDIFYGAGKVSGRALNGTQDDLKRLFSPSEIERGKRDLTKYSQYKQGQVKEWFEKTGGINGEPYGIHVDLASREKLRREIDRWVKSTES